MLADILANTTLDIICCEFGDEVFLQHVSVKYIDQVVLQILTITVNFALYIRALETEIIYIVIIYFLANGQQTRYLEGCDATCLYIPT